MCGAAVTDAKAAHCLYCSARLATISCPHCFALMYRESRHCPRCGTSAASRLTDENEKEARQASCPRCRLSMVKIVLGQTSLRECNSCNGLWVDVASFEQICADCEQQSAVLGAAHFASAQRSVSAAGKVSYVPCPECGHLMNRVNFARCSGVVVDVCKGHGTWFDQDELCGIVEFIRAGGLDQARAREKAQLEETRRSLQAEQLAVAAKSVNVRLMDDEERHTGLVHTAVELLKILKNW